VATIFSQEVDNMADDLTAKLGELLKKKPWYELPRLLADVRLYDIRKELRAKNLHDTQEPPEARQEIPANLDPELRHARTIDGTYNDLNFPKMGSAGCRFARNFPLDQVAPDTPNLLIPNPRVVSVELMTREQFQPATFLNLLAAAWIQFMVHDWFVHERSKTNFAEIPTSPGDGFGAPSIRVPRSVPDPAPAGSTRPPAYANLNSHWWDASQLYGSDANTAAKVRTQIGGKLRIEPTGLLPVDPETGVNFSGFDDNWWIGLAMLHTLFTLEHNAICDLLAHQHTDWHDDQLFRTARLINSALLAKIHTLEWTCAIVPNPIIVRGMHVNWSGLAGEDKQDVLHFLNESDVLGGIIGSHHDHHSAPYAFTEEFVAVYRMHPLMPDDLTFNSLVTGRVLETQQLPEVAGRNTPSIAERITMSDLFYSFGTCHPGAVTLHNYPRTLQNLTRDDGEHLDLAAVDIFRDRERGVPRYNQFRRLIHKDPVKSFDELTDNPAWRKQIKAVYNGDLERVDLMTGLFAEPLAPGFGFSETAFRVFILMASRRLKSDRFFTDDYGPEMYTEFGVDYLKKNSMVTVLKRHFPQLAPALSGVENAFAPWKATKGPAGPA
jgi:Animal haem peroxidase